MNNALLEQFLSEAREALEAIGEKLMRLENAPDDAELMTELFRLVHTLKGNSGLFDFPEMTRVLHAGEDLMDAVRKQSLQYSQELADRLLDAMDFVALLCDEAEAGREQGGLHVDGALQLAQALRALILEDTSAAKAQAQAQAQAQAPASEASASASQEVVALIALMPEAIRQDAQLRLRRGEALHLLSYTPQEECFYQGDDPLYQVMQTPGCLWGGLQAREPWPALQELDAFRCMLDFQVLSTASSADLLEHFRYVPEQRQIFALTMQDFAQLAAPQAQAPSQPEALLSLLEAQREVLNLPDDAPWLAGRIQAASGVLIKCLSSTGRAKELPELRKASEQAQSTHSAAPLADWLAAAFPQNMARPLPPTAAAPENMDSESAEAWPAEAAEAAEGELKFGRRAEDTPGARSLKVDQAKVDRLMNLIGEMVVAKNAIPYLAHRAETVYGERELAREIKTQYAVINRISEEMQDAIMQVRMMPVSFVFQRFPRLVRDTSRKLGKTVNLILEGQDTAADKNIIESLGDPLVHIVRNSLDHGLELPEQRRAAGKPAEGSLRISARQDADRVLIEISDDGRGIDPLIVKRKAYEKGLIDEHTLERLSDQEAINLVFAPGFSTAEVVSDLSGRGVGMDVVRSAVERVNGSISLESRLGQGTTLRLSLPLSMAVSNVMTIESAGQVFGVPMDAVVETVRIPQAQVRQIKQSAVTTLRGRVVPLRSLNSLLNLPYPQLNNEDNELAVLIVRIFDETIGLVVDEFRGTADIILKPLAGVLSQLSSYAGSALMGDGSVLMVLNIKEVL